MEEEKIIKDIWSPKWLYASIWFFILVILLSAFLYYYNSSISTNIQELNSQIEERNKSIEELKNDKKIIVYELINKNQQILDKYKKESQIPDFIDELDRVWRDYSITLNWFSYTKWSVSSSAVATKTIKNDAYIKVSDFLRDYRTNSWSMFDVDFVNSFQWDSTIWFNLKFSLKD